MDDVLFDMNWDEGEDDGESGIANNKHHIYNTTYNPSYNTTYNSPLSKLPWWGTARYLFKRVRDIDSVSFHDVWLRAHCHNTKIFNYERSKFIPPEPEIEIALNIAYNLFGTTVDTTIDTTEFRNCWYGRLDAYYTTVINPSRASQS
jgi:hypothetical protein